MSDNCRVSEALYVGLCDYIGTPTEVAIRREVMDMREMIIKPLQIHEGQRVMYSGSLREGFRFTSSDVDLMYWCTNHKVITDLSQSSFYDLSKHSIILMEDTDTPPGFARLHLLASPRIITFASSLVRFNDGMYLSNSKWRKIMLTWIKCKKSYSSIKYHGPCANSFMGCVESDHVLCLHCSYWPKLTEDWRKRCALHNWPPKHVLEAILKHGCHLVPVGSKILPNENEDELEWRMSFSLAEQKLVYSMNHTQFLCYGLLKIFLQEVVNRDVEEPFLCSYFVKTTMFWLMQTGHITWCPRDLLDCFWKCVMYLLYCSNQGMLPNFFIPQNNMFASKLTTAKGVRELKSLSEKLNGYYKTGMPCLLQSPTIRSIIEPYMCDTYTYLRIEPFSGHALSPTELDECVKNEIERLCTPFEDIQECTRYLNSISSLSESSLTEFQTLALQKCFVEVLIEAGFFCLNSLSSCRNRNVKLIENLLKVAGKFGDVSDLMYLVMYYYRTCRYREALHIITLVKSRLNRSYLLYKSNTVDAESYNKYVTGFSLSRRMKKAWVSTVNLRVSVYYIKELILEQKAIAEKSRPLLHISPYVFADMLSVLCNNKIGNGPQCQQSLTHLQTLLLLNDERYVPLLQRALSWQILGICQHALGDLNGAIHSFQVCLKQKSDDRIQKATLLRITLAVYQLVKGNNI